MATEIRHKGPIHGQIVHYNNSGTVIAAMITGINSDGTISLTTFPAGSSPSTASNVRYDYTGASGTWWWSDNL